MTRRVPILKDLKTKAAKSALPRVAVVVSSYKGSSASTAALDEDVCTPAHWVDKDFPYRFTYHEITKMDAHQQIRKLVKDIDDPVHCFFNLCDGALEEDRAGVEVIRALEMFNVPFTGPTAEGFEPNKVTMKLLADKAGVRIPPFALVQKGQNTAVRCRHLKFPVIVKPPSGFASVGITKDSKCHNMKELEKQVAVLIKDLDVALVEEFITGREGTVLVCRDEKSKDGVHVFPPINIKFPGGAEDFGSFENKWDPATWGPDSKNILAYDLNDPVYPKIIEMARRAYAAILQGYGYGRVDFRIDDKHGTGPYFLEINPNCGMWYPKESGGDWADIMVKYDKDWDHGTFAKNQIETAVKDHQARQRWWRPTVDATRQFVTKATISVPAATKVFGDIRPVPIILKASFTEKGSKLHPGCVLIRGDDRSQMIALKHSCKPNLQVIHGCTLELETCRPVRKGDILTIDYSTIRDPDMPAFECKCGAEFCRGTVRAQLPRPRKARPVLVSRRARMLALKNADAHKKATAASSTTAAAENPTAGGTPSPPPAA